MTCFHSKVHEKNQWFYECLTARALEKKCKVHRNPDPAVITVISLGVAKTINTTINTHGCASPTPAEIDIENRRARRFTDNAALFTIARFAAAVRQDTKRGRARRREQTVCRPRRRAAVDRAAPVRAPPRPSTFPLEGTENRENARQCPSMIGSPGTTRKRPAANFRTHDVFLHFVPLVSP